MAWGNRIRRAGLIALAGLLAGGCSGGRSAGIGGPSGGLIAANLEESPRLARSQLPDLSPPQPFRAAGADAKTPWALPPVQPGVLPAGSPVLPGASTLGAQQVSAILQSSDVRVKVRAWVNGRPIFDDELVQVVGPFVREVARLSEPQRTEKMTEMVNNALDQLIDQEVMYQDAIKKLEKNNPRALDKLKDMAHQDYEKQVQKMREGGVPDEQIREMAHTARRMMERSMISTEYARNRIVPHVQTQVTLEQIKEYYEAHRSEFQSVDKVQWQDVFIAVGPKHPTPADAKRFAEEAIAKCRAPEDFAKLMAFDDGDSKFRGGEGFGQKRGEVRPPELEPILFQLKDGQIGPVVELSTGVHVFRLVKREFAGQLPLNEQTQKAIRRKLEGQVAEREYKQLVRLLRDRSVIRIVREGL